MSIKKHQIHGLSPAIRELGLEEYVLQLEIDGIAIVPPEATGVNMAEIDAAAQLLLADSENIAGCPFTLENGPADELDWTSAPFGLHLLSGESGEVTQFQLQSLHSRHRAFRDLIINPVALALVEHTMGVQPKLSSCNAFIKWKGDLGYGSTLGLHCDQGGVPKPWGYSAYNSNATWCLTDYTKDDGALAYVPGSNRKCSDPAVGAEKSAIAAEAPKGSLLVFHGATWHGAYPRKTPGMRLAVANYYRHPSILPQEDMKNGFDAELAQSCNDPELLKQVLGLADGQPYRTTQNTERSKMGMGWLPHVKGTEPHDIQATVE
jgi:hypothetical protein